MIGDRPWDARRIRLAKHVDAQHRGVDRKHAGVVRDEDHRPARGDLVDAARLDAEVALVQRRGCCDRGGDRGWVQPEHVEAVAGVVKRRVLRDPRERRRAHCSRS